jgi:hypothetical protein
MAQDAVIASKMMICTPWMGLRPRSGAQKGLPAREPRTGQPAGKMLSVFPFNPSAPPHRIACLETHPAPPLLSPALHHPDSSFIPPSHPQVLRPGLVKGPWTPEEDETIHRCLAEGITKWSEIADRIPGRIGKQCRERYFNHLDRE